MNEFVQYRNELLEEIKVRKRLASDYTILEMKESAGIAKGQVAILEWAVRHIPNIPPLEAWRCECGTDNNSVDTMCVACRSDRQN
jgi:hypothetical protein